MRVSISTILRFFALYFGLLALFVVSALINDQFLSLANQRDVLWQVSNIGIIAIGMTLVILTAGIDLSVGSLMSVGTVVCAMLLMERGWTTASWTAIPALALTGGGLIGCLVWRLTRDRLGRRNWIAGLAAGVVTASALGAWAAGQVPHGFGPLGVFLLVLPVCLLLGAINGVVIAKANLQPFIVTLAMMVSAVGLARYIAGAGGRVHAIYFDAGDGVGATPAFARLADNISLFGQELIPVPGLFFVATAILAWILLNKTALGRYIYAVGGNEDAVRFSGIPSGRVKIFVYAASGLACGLAAILYSAAYQQGKADAGNARELDAIAAVVIGGTSLMGGRGSIGGTVVGVLIFGYLNNILNLQGVATEFQAIFKGIIIVLAVLLQEGILTRWISQVYRRIRPGSTGGPRPTGGFPMVRMTAELKK